MTEPKTIAIADIRKDATQVRRATSEEPIARYIERYKGKEEMDPIDVCYDGTTYWLADGFHRVEAATRLGAKSMRATVHEGGRSEAWRMGCEKNNRHGLPRSNDDKRYAVGVCLDDPEWSQWSDRAIAEHCAVSNRMVSTMRAERVEASTVNGSQLNPPQDAGNADFVPDEPSKRKGRDGKMRAAGKSDKAPMARPASFGRPAGGQDNHPGDTDGEGGREAPQEGRPAGWDEATEACAAIERSIREAIDTLKAFEATPEGAWLMRVQGQSQVRLALEKAKQDIFVCRPSEACGKCKKGCEHCRKSGWLPKYMTTKNAKSARAAE